MESLYIEQTSTTPKVIFDVAKKIFLIEGESRPENPKEFYFKLVSWIENYNNFIYHATKEHGEPKTDLKIEFKFAYLNSISIKYVFELLQKIESLPPLCNSFEVNWYYTAGDTDMLENGTEYADMVNLKINTMAI